jgi:hypothetical protein
MEKIQQNEQVGDRKAPSLRATEAGLRRGADQAVQISATQPGPAPAPLTLANSAAALKSASTQKGAPAKCKRILWLSFFFDGTGNNRNADLNLLKHSNIVRLFRAHKPESLKDGIFSLYIPGIGTYFPEIGDDGGSARGLGCGAMGEERLSFALKQFDVFLSVPLAKANAQANAIQEINIAVFGFSRGAALARAFVNMVMERRCDLRERKWILKRGAWPVRFRFLGLFDTVASVGLPMSSNTTGLRETYYGDTAGMILKRLRNYQETRPEALAFFANGSPGADPAPGSSNGHDGWGARLKIHETVEEVRHFIAAHEIRNSFPVDSVSVLTNGRMLKPGNFYEAVYPGAHSDVGGGYAPGEGARGLIPSKNLCLIPLRHMYDFALRCGVPMLAEWTPDNRSDFKTDASMLDAYDLYLKAVGTFSTLGEGINKNMSLYYSWRFRAIRKRLGGEKYEADLISAQNLKFTRQGSVLTKEISGLATKETVARVSLSSLREAQDMQASASDGSIAQKVLTVSEADVEEARRKYENAHNEHLKAKARKNSLPNMVNFQANLDLYDRQLLADVQSILNALRIGSGGKQRYNLRPHYKMLLDAYENEFLNNSGLQDEGVIRFFDDYVHDSLAGFAMDATLPSDPRAVYLGGNEKYRYASLEEQDLFAHTETRIA